MDKWRAQIGVFMNVNDLIIGNMDEMGLIHDRNISMRSDGDFLTAVEYELAEELLPDIYTKEGAYGEKMLVATPDVYLERVTLYWYFRMNNGEIFDGYEEDSYIAMDDRDLPDLIIITSRIRFEMGTWQQAMIPFLMSTNREVSLYDNRIVVDTWENVVDYAFEKECFFIFDDYEDALGGDSCEEAADSFFTIVDGGQLNIWIMTTRSNRKCGVFPALSGPSEIY